METTKRAKTGLSVEERQLYEHNLSKFKDERDAIQKKTFTKWVNKHLKKHWTNSKTYTQLCIFPETIITANRHVNDLFTDLQDGLNLISLLEVLSGEHLHREKGRMRFHALQNVELVLNFLRYKKIKLVNIRPEDIVDGNPKLTLGLIWTIILHFQISDIVLSQREENVSPKEVLLKWAKKSTARYPEVRVSDFTTSWRDGLAFNALIHRNRPDLIDWRSVKTKTVRERLETAFYSAEKVGVTRLLDPEDVDTHEIDEKSIITYISSIYDVFPEPPAKHPLYDNESQVLTQEYREVASSLHLWICEYTSVFSERTLPATLQDLVKASQESSRFKTYEVPAKQSDRQKLSLLYTELQKIYESTGEVDIEPELHIDVLERNWNKLLSLHQERDQQLQDEIKKFERLDRLAERLSRDCKRVDSRLDDVESRVTEESRRLERLHPLDAKRNAESLESEMRSIEETINGLVQDLGILKTVGHQAAPGLERRVTKLHQKWVALRSSLHQKLIARLASMSFPVVEERTVTRQTRTVLETRLVDTNHHFRSLQQAIDWCKAKIKLINESDLGNDLAGVKIELSHHEREHKEIDRFKTTVEQCAAAKTQFTGEEQQLYQQHLNTLHKVYSELLTTSNKRLSDLESLLDYLQSLQNQLAWLSEKEAIEVARDWSDPNINLLSVQHYHDNLMSELEKREVSVRSVLERGNSLVLQNHPAGKTISRWTELLKEAWSRLLQFSLACEIHTEATRKYQEYQKDLREAEAWLQSRDELLNTVYSASEFSLDEGERLLKGMQEMREELNKKAPLFAELTARAAKVPPIRQRRLPVTRPIQVTAVCNYTSDTVYIEKEDTWLLHDNSALTQWRVSSLSSRSNDTNVPGVVFFIPPPGKELLEGAERLNRSFESTTSLWQKKHMRLRQNMIFATIRVVRSWDLAQFVGMGSEQRNAIRRALNEDADKLLSEGDPSDPQLRRLRREMEEVNRLFEELERRARQEDEQKAALREFTETSNRIQTTLDEYERTLNNRILNSIARDSHTLERQVLQHKDFENDLKSLTPEIDSLQVLFNTLPRKSHQHSAKVESILQQWNTIWNYSHLYVERMKCVEIVLASLDEARNVVSELEIKLASFGEMPSELEPLRDVHDDLIRLQNAIAARQPVVDQLIDDATNTRRVVVRSRDRTSEREHGDLDRLDEDVNSVTKRWNDLCANLVHRLRSCEAAYSLLDNFGQTYQTEVKFIDESYKQLNELPPVSHAKHHIEPTKVLFTSIVERTQPLEQVNIDGGRFIREAKIYAVSLRRYADDVMKWNPSFERPEYEEPSPTTKVEQMLDNLNQRFLTLVTVMQDRIRQMAALSGDKDLQEFVRMMKPAQLRTFRTVFSITETTKQISSKWLPDTCDMGNQMNGRSEDEKSSEIINEKGITDPETGRVLTIGEAIRKRILDVRNGTVRVKGDTLSLKEAAEQGVIQERLVQRLLAPVVGAASLLEQIQRELLNAENPVSQFCLSDFISLDLVYDEKVLDRKTGNLLTFGDAVKSKIMNPDFYEIYSQDKKITLRDGLKTGFKMADVEKPLSLKDAVDFDMVDDGLIVTRYGKLTVEDAVLNNILDTNYNTILDPDTNNLITLQEALNRKIIKDGLYLGKTFQSAVQDGDFSTVNIQSVFDIGLIRFGEEYKSLKILHKEGIFDKGTFKMPEIQTLEELESQNLVRREVKDILMKKIGVKSSGKELSVFEAVSMGLLDIKTGLLVDRKHKQIGYEEALKKKLITKEGLSTLKSVLCITLTTQTKTVKKYIDNEGTPGKKLVSEDIKVVEKGFKKNIKNILDSMSRVPDKGWLLRDAIEKKVLDPNRGIFTVPGTDREVSFEECLKLGIIDEKSGRVVDLKRGRELSFLRAIEKRIMDKHGNVNGHDMEACIKNGLILLDDTSPDPLHVEKGVIFDPSSSLVILTKTGESLKFSEALKSSKLDPKKVRVNGLSLQDALDNGLLSDDFLEFNGPEGKMSVGEAIKLGYVTVEGRSVVKKYLIIDKKLSPRDLALRGVYDPKKSKFTIPFKEVCDKIFDPDDVFVKNLTLRQALEQNLFDEDGNLYDGDQKIPFFQAVKMSWIYSKEAKPRANLTLHKAIEQKILDPQTVKVKYENVDCNLNQAILDNILDPDEIVVKADENSDFVGLNEAVETKLLDLNEAVLGGLSLDAAFKVGFVRQKMPPIALENIVDGITLRDPLTGNIIDVKKSINLGIVDPDISYINGEKASDQIIKPGDEIKTKLNPFTIIEAINRGYYKNGKFLDPRINKYLTLRESIDKKLIDPTLTCVKDPKNDELLDLDKSEGILDFENGTFNYPFKMDLKKAYLKGFILPKIPPMSLPEAAVQEYKLKNLKSDLGAGKILNTPCLVNDNEILTPGEALELGLFDPESNTYRGIRLEKAVAAGFLLPKILSVKEAVDYAVYSPKSGLFNERTLNTALENLIDPDTTIVRTDSGPESFKTAVDKTTGRIATQKGELTLDQAFKKGVLYDLKVPCSLKDAYENLYSDNLFLDPKTNEFLSLKEAIDSNLIGNDENLIKTDMGLVDLKTGYEYFKGDLDKLLQNCVYKPKNTLPLQKFLKDGLYKDGRIFTDGKEMSLNLALREHKIDLDAPFCIQNNVFLTPKEAVVKNILDPRKGVFKEENIEIPLENAYQLELVQNLDKIGPYEAVRHDCGLEYANVENSKLLKNGLFVDLPSKENAKELVKEKKIVSTVKNQDLEAINDSGLIRDSGIVNPEDNSINSLEKSLEIGLINPNTTRFKNRALNVKNLPSLESVSEGFVKGDLATVRESLKDRSERLGIPIKGEMKLRDAINSGLIDPRNWSVKEKGVKLVKFIESKSIDLDVYGYLDGDTFHTKDLTLIKGIMESFKTAIENNKIDLDKGLYKFNDVNLSLMDAINCGYLDPNTIVVKDTSRRRFYKINEAFKKGITDDKGNTLDRKNSRLYNLKTGLESEIIYLDNISLIDSIDYGVYNPTNGLFTDPFSTETGMSRPRLNLAAAIGSGMVSGTSAVFRDRSGAIKSVQEAISSGSLDAVRGRFRTDDGEDLDLVKAKDRGIIVRAQSRQAMEEKYKLCDDSLRQLLEWMSDLEDRLAKQEPAQESLNGIRDQINLLKLIKEEIESQQRMVQSCLDDVRNIISNGTEFLARDEISSLERNSKSLKTRYDKSNVMTERLLRRIISASEELHKFRSEATVFSEWLEKTKRVVTEKEKMTNLRPGDSISELVNDVISHQADLRFITMAGQKFADESKEFLNSVNEYRAGLTSRPGLVEPYQGSELRRLVADLTKEYKDLSIRVTELSERLSGLGGRQREYKSALDRARQWMQSAEPRANKILAEPLAADPHSLDEQLVRAKSLNTEFAAQSRLFDNLRQSLELLIRSVEGQATRSEINELTLPVEELSSKYDSLSSGLTRRIESLDNALSQSQGVENALENVVAWLSNAENNIKSLTRPASLNKPRLEEQVRAVRAPLSEIVAYRSSIESVVVQAKQLTSSATNPRLAKRIDGKVKDVLSRYEKLLERTTKLSELLNEVTASLDEFSSHATEVENWLQEANDGIAVGGAGAVDVVVAERDAKREPLERVLREGRSLLARKDVTDTSQVRDRIKNIETQWRDLNTLLDEKARLSKIRAEQALAYDKLRDQIVAWLNAFEGKVGRLEPVALHMDIIKRQTEELKPLVKEHRDFAPTIDRLFDIGSSMEATERPESPTRRRSSVSPVKRLSTIGRKSSQELTSPTPTKVYVTSPMSPVSSGFGSRRSSQEVYHVEDFTGTQQEVAELNNRYSSLGLKLSERTTELETTKEELRKSLEHMRSLDGFIERTNRALPRDTLCATKDEADKTNKVVKSLLEEMYEKQALLESTKSSVSELLRKKQNAPGAEALQKQLEEILAKWKALHDLCKSRIQILEDLKDLYDTHEHLGTWLSAKERMVGALGPISSDPRMVQSQVEQVQVLREELRAMRPQLSHLETTTASLVTRAKWTPLEAKLKSVTDRWSALAKKLDDRAACLGVAVDSSREFDSGLNRLRDTLQNISEQVDAAQTEKDPEQHLRKIQACERQLEGARQLLADAEAAGEELCKVLTDAGSRAEIQGKLSAVNKQYNALQAKVDRRRAEIEGLLRDGREFDATVAKTLGWLSDELSSLQDRLLISADREVLQQQVDAHEPVYKEVMSREHQVIMLLDRGQSQRADKSSSRNLDSLRSQWDKLKREASERHTRLHTSMEHCRKYYKSLEAFVPWLSQAESRLESLRPDSFSRRDLDKHLRDLATFRNDVWKKSGEFEHLRSLGDTFVSSCDIDKDIVLQEVAAAKSRWDKLNNELLLKTSTLEELGRRLVDAADRLRGVSHSVQRCEDRLGSHDSISAHADPATVARLASLRDEVASLRKPLESLRTICDELDEEVSQVAQGRTSGLGDEVAALAERLDDLSSRLDDRCDRAQIAAKAVQQYNDKIKHLTTDLSTLEDEFASMKPPGRDMKTLRSQQDQLTGFNGKLARAGDDVAAMQSLADALVDSGFSADATRQQAENVSKRLSSLESASRKREQALDAAIEKLLDFNNKIDAADTLVERAFDELKRLKPVGSEPDTIRSQQDESASLRATMVEPAGAAVEVAIAAGQILVQTASPGVSTAQVERDCECISEKWNDLKEKMTDRDKKLNAGLLQSGKFQEALEGLSKWLSDMEDMVANQKAPSADYKVVKAQLQEQKFLKKMLLDRQGSMSSLVVMGREVAANCDSTERSAVERQLKSLADRFEDLTEKAATRMTALEQAMAVAKSFHDKMNPVNDWLQRTEKKIKDMELVPTDEEKIQQKIREHDALHEEILHKKTDLSDLTDIASQLASLVSDDDASGIADQVQEAANRYSKLVHASEDVATLLESARGRLRHLVVTYQQLQAWMEGMDHRLSRFKVLAVHTEQLYAQMEDLADLSEEISNQQGNVDSTVDAGHELMRSISSDEAIQLKDKLDSLQRRYNDLTVRGSDLLKQAQEALPLVQQFHNSHNKLVDWMHGAETTLQSADPREESIHALEMDIQEFRPVLENVNQLGPQLCSIGPGEGAATIEGLVTRDNRRFDAISEQVQRKAERLQLCKQRSLEVLSDVDSLLEWFREVEAQLREAEPPSSEPQVIRLQLKEHKALNDDIASQKGRVRDILDTAKKVLRESPQYEDNSVMRDKMVDLRETMDSVWRASGDRLSLLEQALGLAQHFESSHSELVSWLDEKTTEARNLRPSSLRPQALIQDQAVTQRLLQSISEHKPLVDKLNKTGESLIKLVPYEEGTKVQEMLDSDNSRYNELRNMLKARQEALEKALQESSEFSDKLEGMLRALSNAAEEMNSAEPVSAHPPKIRQQLKENEALIDEVAKREEAFEAVKKAASDVIAKSPSSDPAVKDIKRKLDKLQQLWKEVNDATKTRNKSLSEALEVAARFWSALEAVMTTLAEIERTLIEQEPPALKPELVRRQGEALGIVKSDIDHTKPRVEDVRKTGASLMALCGEADKPEVRKNIEDLDSAWDTVTSLFARREENLLDAMERAMEFHETLKALKEFLQQAESRFSALGPLGEDIGTIRQQMKEVKDLKASLDPMMIKVESLNRQAAELTERSTAEQAQGLKESLSSVNSRWDELHRGIAERYRQLENALLRLGQFQQALSELLTWISNTDKSLDTEMSPTAVDPHLLEVQLAKLKVLMNDMTAHQSSVDTLNDAGRQIVEESRGADDTTQERLKDLNKKWKALLDKAADRQTELEEALRQGQRFSAEIQDLLGWLSEVDSVIASSKPVGGLPETASEQLDRFMVVYDELEGTRPRVEAVLQRGAEMLRKSPSESSSHTQGNLKTLKSRWESVTSRANDKKIKLEIALKEATEFHDALQSFMNWLTSAEKTLSNLKPVSRVLETILNQIEEHKAFQKEVGVHRETMLQLDKKGTHLKYFSQKQDVILIKNLLISVQHRWERVVSKSAERTRALDHGYKEAKDFHDSWSNLMNWLRETDVKLDEMLTDINSAANDPIKLRQRLVKHRETQKAIAGKQIAYDATLRAAKTLRERAPKVDELTLKNMASELKELWNTVSSKAVVRQRNLEEALLYCGQVKDALDALLDWLRKTHKDLSEDGPVHGDLDTVQNLIEKHKNLEQDMENRKSQVESVEKSGRELASKSDARQMSDQVSEMTDLWRKTTHLAQKRGAKLQSALKQAEELHRSVHQLLEWLSDAESKLRLVDNLSDDETETRIMMSEHEKFMRELADKEREKDSTIRLAEEILGKAHPDAVQVVKHWISVIQSRWDEVTSWSRQRNDKLKAQLRSLQDMDALLEELLAWLGECESTLISLEHQELPDNVPATQVLVDEHQFFMETMAKRTTEIDMVVKAKTIKERKVSKKSGSTQELHELTRRQSLKSSREHLLIERRTSRSSGKEFSDPTLPHIGPKFPTKGSKTPEPQFKCARSRLLYDRWRSAWLMSWERQRRLRDHLLHLGELERLANFSWDDWRKRFLRFMNHKKSRLTDLFRKMDKNNDGLIPRDDFVDGIIKTKFDTNRPEMGAVADMFDHNSEGYIDWKEFIAALRPDWEEKKPTTEAEKIHDEVKRLVMLCTCRQKFRVFQVGEGKYRFGDSQKLRLVRILRSTVMVRVGGGWVALEEFLVKNDPCRVEMLPIPNPFIPEEHEAWCPLSVRRSSGELLSELMPIFEKLREREENAMKSEFPITVAQRIHTPHTCQIREKSSKSVPMASSRGTPGSVDSLSDLDSSPHTPNYMTPRKSSLRAPSSSTPGSLPGSRSNSRPASRQNSKPPSRHASNLSLASSDDGTPSRIPRMSVPSRTSTTGTATQRKMTAPGALNGSKSPSGRGKLTRASSIPTLANRSSTSKIPVFIGSGDVSHSTSSSGQSRIPIYSYSTLTSPTSTSSGHSMGIRQQRTPSGRNTPSGRTTPKSSR
ncbi:microtubule-actin cross-linking factor 1 isoform X6 [Cimex lectularius]|uniref:Microtubule-actin cross-linking factor 1 n=1 Tax=Cimex lectularius TaxID=79782 RepID=A0A8I6SUG3_CIMLE|nr:microtubule-actin cross-linking factor 1 isoform X6 [Cimex lectularius]